MKKLFALFLAFCMVACMMPISTVSAAGVTASGTCGENLAWVLYTDGELAIFGSGEMTDWELTRDRPWHNYSSQINSIIIENGVTSIGKAAFCNFPALTNVQIPASVANIGEWSFNDCDALASIDIPEGVTIIGDNAFQDCASLININLPESLNLIGNAAFQNCTSLARIDIPSGVKSIGALAFGTCNCLRRVNLNYGLNSIGDSAFFWCSSLENIELPNSLISIGFAAFASCQSLTRVELPESVANIGAGAFDSCSLLVCAIVKNNNAVFDGKVFYKVATDFELWGYKNSTAESYSAKYNHKFVPFALEAGVFSVVFKDYDGKIISHANYKFGDSVIVPAAPTREDDSTYTYTFAGWDKEIQTVNGNAEYIAQYTPKHIDYTVVFKNYNGDVISTATYHYGDDVVLPTAPIREADNTYMYTFSGWDKEVVTVNGDAEYIAQFKATLIPRDAPWAVVGNTKGRAGETVTVDITVKNADKVGSLAISNITYNSDIIEFVSFEWKVENTLLKNFDVSKGKGAVAFENGEDVNGVIGTLTFKIKDVAADGDYTVSCDIEAQIGRSDYEIYDVAGSVTVYSVVRGDADGDEYVTKDDAIYVLMYTFFAEDYPANQDFDFNDDGYVTKDDAIYVLMYTFFPEDYPIK